MGCRCDRDLLPEIRAVLEPAQVTEVTWRGMPPLVHPMVIGAARRPDTRYPAG
jgi:hypothetical protein